MKMDEKWHIFSRNIQILFMMIIIVGVPSTFVRHRVAVNLNPLFFLPHLFICLTHSRIIVD